MDWQPEEQPERVDVMKLYMHSQSRVTVSQLKYQPHQGRNRPRRHLRKQLLTAGLGWEPFVKEALNMESQCGLSKGQYNSPPPVCVHDFRLPVISHTLRILDLSRNKGRRIIFFKEKCHDSSLCRHITHLHKQDLALNSPRWLICLKTQTNRLTNQPLLRVLVWKWMQTK